MYQEMFAPSGGGGGGSTTYTVTTLYKNGLQQGTVESAKSTGTGTTVATDEGTYLKTSVSNNNYIYAWVGIKVDLTNINYVVFYDTSITSVGSGQGVYASPTIGGTSMPSISQLTTGTNKSFKIMLDVSSLSGENYVGILSYTGSGGGAREARCSLIELVQVNFP